MRAVFAFTPWESKRLIGRAVANSPEVKYAFEHTQIIIAHGSTNVYVAEELLGRRDDRDVYVSGQMINGVFCQTEPDEKPVMLRLIKGKPVPPAGGMSGTLEGWDDKCVFIKGANAVDPEFNAGIFNAHHAGGTIGFAFGAICGTGISLVVPVGLEKMIPSVREASRELGHAKAEYFSGTKIGMTPIINGKVITEIQAFEILFGVKAVAVGGGGVAGSEGTVVISVSGEEAKVRAAITLVEERIKGEKPLALKKRRCASCVEMRPAFTAGRNGEGGDIKTSGQLCMYSGKAESELPSWFQKREPIQA